ncbi:MAG: hypothetical protein IJX20_00765, partial [Alphaproteobacteria bacterium]|nr:hypothetical protein [Alphaproteobacteria bacterium]
MLVNYTIDKDANIVCISGDGYSAVRCEKDVFSHLVFYKFDTNYWLIVDSFNDRLELVCNETKISVFEELNCTDPYWNYYVNVFKKDKE